MKFKFEVEMEYHKCECCQHKEFHRNICRLMLTDSGDYRHIHDVKTHPDWCPLKEVSEGASQEECEWIPLKTTSQEQEILESFHRKLLTDMVEMPPEFNKVFVDNLEDLCS